MNVKPYIEITLTIVGDSLNFTYIKDKLNLSPTTISLKEELSPFLPYKDRKDCWNYTIERIGCNELELVFDEFISVFESRLNLVIEICNEFNARVSVTVVTDMINDMLPQLVISPKIISFLHLIKAELGFDIYSYIDRT